MSLIDETAKIANPPEDRNWTVDTVIFSPIIEEGVRISPFVTVDCGTKRSTVVGKGSFLLAHSHVGHDVIVGENVTLATGAILGGFAEVGDNAKIGLGAIVLPFRKIGANAVVGAGSVITRDVPDDATVAGNPARVIATNAIPFTEREHGV